MEVRNKGTLYLCATPIGNLEDMTLRGLRVLKEVDLIAAESISRTRKLLSHYDIHTSLASYREEDRESQGQSLLASLKSGKSVALVSDAGMPGLSDPGQHLLKLCRAEDIPVVAVPGPSASITAVVMSGFSASRFVFEGFLPRRRKKRMEIYRGLSEEKRTAILFEAPHRLRKTLEELSPVVNERRVCVVRELTKKFEEIIWGTCRELLTRFSPDIREPRGEMCLVIDGKASGEVEGGPDASDSTVEDLLRQFMERGYAMREAVKEVARIRAMPHREVYEKGLRLKGKK